ncbi:hypothetical protein GCM10010412_028060 [Nonomuraea recticatena]|uniref:Uncharacterized protein n=1 Tax=Nonomuraea recticatena TaxID=46178 RepID=A0ABP6E114_9ACTN
MRVSVTLDDPRSALLRDYSTVPLRVEVGQVTVFDDSDQARAAHTTPRTLLAQLVDSEYGATPPKR